MLSQKDPYAKSDSIALAGKEFFAIHGSSSARSIDRLLSSGNTQIYNNAPQVLCGVKTCKNNQNKLPLVFRILAIYRNESLAVQAFLFVY